MQTKIPCPVCGKHWFAEECDCDICEYCGVDSVFSDSKVDLSTDLLKYMYKVWFE